MAGLIVVSKPYSTHLECQLYMYMEIVNNSGRSGSGLIGTAWLPSGVCLNSVLSQI